MVHTGRHQPFAARHIDGRPATIDDRDFEPRETGFDGGGQPGRTTTDNQDVSHGPGSSG